MQSVAGQLLPVTSFFHEESYSPYSVASRRSTAPRRRGRLDVGPAPSSPQTRTRPERQDPTAGRCRRWRSSKTVSTTRTLRRATLPYLSGGVEEGRGEGWAATCETYPYWSKSVKGPRHWWRVRDCEQPRAE